MGPKRLSTARATAPGGRAVVGSSVRVAGEAGRTMDFELVDHRDPVPHGLQVTPTSPVGEVLMGARPGDVVRVRLPSGRDRVLQVLEVRLAGPER